MSKEPTRHQLSSKLAYSSNTPAFLQKLQRRIAGGADEEDDEYEYDGSGRPPIPRRPSIPERPEGDPGSADEDEVEEAPQVVVLKEGKHLTAHEAENERRIAKGLAPLPDPNKKAQEATDIPDATASGTGSSNQPKTQSEGLSFSSGGSASNSSKKRKIITSEDGDSKSKKPTKKPKKANKKLLSFDM